MMAAWSAPPAGSRACAPESKLCGARTRDGGECRAPTVREKTRCHFHGGGVNPNGRGSGAPRGNQNALRHGRRTAAAIAERRALATLLQRLGEAPEEAT